MKTKTYYPSVAHMILANPIKTATVCFVFVIGMVLVLSGCTVNSKPTKSDVNPDHLVYFKDTRTNVCYAAMNSTGSDGFSSTTITYVPCTPEVEKMIEDGGK